MTISIDAWADGPDSSGRWRGCWRLIRNGAAIRGRFGVTADYFTSEALAVTAALRCGTSDKRNVPGDDMFR
ncbi:hypothetical protein [Dyella sp. ASV21]|jgi:hypothetical protein|uniref:hypothetical protein n=1 Tax=Dyella sp. ASV21 TaxID=2795114 RepID=UPI0018EB72CA|nr:hypothetical protein [Dyella sp. ASV21]